MPTGQVPYMVGGGGGMPQVALWWHDDDADDDASGGDFNGPKRHRDCLLTFV